MRSSGRKIGLVEKKGDVLAPVKMKLLSVSKEYDFFCSCKIGCNAQAYLCVKEVILCSEAWQNKILAKITELKMKI